MDRSEPPSRPQSNSPFFIGRNSRGQWVVRDQRGLCGGLFINRAEALRYVLFENGHHPEAIIVVPGNLELNIGQPVNVATLQSKSHRRQDSKSALRHTYSNQRKIDGSPALAHG
jgi:hypothetical protein